MEHKTFCLTGGMEQTLLISAVRYALGRSTYMPSLTCRVLREHADDIEPSTAAIIARDIREHWTSYEGPDSPERTRTSKTYYGVDVEPFVQLLPILDERSKGCKEYSSFIPYLPIGYDRWEHVPEEIRFKEDS